MEAPLERTSQHPKGTEFRGVLLSIGLHASLFVFLISRQALFPASKPIQIEQTLRVDLVGLPDLVKAEMPTAMPAPAPPTVDEPEAAQRDTAAPPPPEKSEMVIPKKESEKASKPAPEVNRKNQIANALKRIKSIEKLKDQEEKTEREEAQEAAVIKGNKVSPGNSLSGEAKEALEVSYYEKVKDALAENWSLPPWLAKQELSAQVMVQLDSNGQLQNLRFLKSSGNAQFDNIVKNTIRDSLPLPRPPKNLIGQMTDKGMVLGFPL